LISGGHHGDHFLWIKIDVFTGRLTSKLMISQLPTDQWYQSIGYNTLADAILVRFMRNAHRA
jgi:hypothetical protein